MELLSLLPFLLQLLTPLLSNQSPPSTLSPSTTPPTSPPRPTTHHHLHFPFGGPLAFPSFAYGAYGAGFPPFPDYHFPAAYPAFSGEWLVFYFMVDWIAGSSLIFICRFNQSNNFIWIWRLYNIQWCVNNSICSIGWNFVGFLLSFLFQTTSASLHTTTLASHCCTGSPQTLKAEEEKLAGWTEENRIEEVRKELVGKAKREM